MDLSNSKPPLAASFLLRPGLWDKRLLSAATSEPMMDLFVRHVTTYSYSVPVTFGPHRLMIRPRDSFDIRILDTQIEITPRASLQWMHDVYGNPIAIATFHEMSDRLEVTSGLVLRRYASAFPSSRDLSRAPFAPHYSDGERIVLQPFMAPATDDEGGALVAWLGEVLAEAGGGADPLARVSQAIHSGFGYSVRFEEGTQAPGQTIVSRSGSCRDLAWLFIEAVRRLGYAARFVTGYLHNQGNDDPANRAAVGLTHAWAEVFVPGDGWVEFDPTNALVADPHLIRVAVARVPGEASPIAGSFTGPFGAQLGLAVGVDISRTVSHANVA